MATYAAYRHVELDKVGCGKRSIMKPPGGDCHDIFGADFHGTPSHHRVLKPPGGGTSSLFAPNEDEAPKPRTVPSATDSVKLQNSHPSGTAINGIDGKMNGVNGKSGNDDSVSVKEPRESEIKEKRANVVEPLSAQDSTTSAEIQYMSGQEDKRQRAMSRNCVTGEGCQTTDHFVIRVHRQRDGNPVTGEGYDTPDQHVTAPPRARVPPGGYSSGLW